MDAIRRNVWRKVEMDRWKSLEVDVLAYREKASAQENDDAEHGSDHKAGSSIRLNSTDVVTRLR